MHRRLSIALRRLEAKYDEHPLDYAAKVMTAQALAAAGDGMYPAGMYEAETWAAPEVEESAGGSDVSAVAAAGQDAAAAAGATPAADSWGGAPAGGDSW